MNPEVAPKIIPPEFVGWNDEEMSRLTALIIRGKLLQSMVHRLREGKIFSPGNRRRIATVVDALSRTEHYRTDKRFSDLVAQYRDALFLMARHEAEVTAREQSVHSGAPLGHGHFEETKARSAASGLELLRAGSVSHPTHIAVEKTQEQPAPDAEIVEPLDDADVEELTDEERADILMEGVPLAPDADEDKTQRIGDDAMMQIMAQNTQSTSATSGNRR